MCWVRVGVIRVAAENEAARRHRQTGRLSRQTGRPDQLASCDLCKIGLSVCVPFNDPASPQDAAAAYGWRSAVEAWPWERIFCSHFDPLIEDGREQFRKCFAFVKPGLRAGQHALSAGALVCETKRGRERERERERACG